MKKLTPFIVIAFALVVLFSLVPNQRTHVSVDPQKTCNITNIRTHEVSEECYELHHHEFKEKKNS